MTNEEIIELMYGNNPLVSKDIFEALKVKARIQDLKDEVKKKCEIQNVNQN